MIEIIVVETSMDGENQVANKDQSNIVMGNFPGNIEVVTTMLSLSFCSYR